MRGLAAITPVPNVWLLKRSGKAVIGWHFNSMHSNFSTSATSVSISALFLNYQQNLLLQSSIRGRSHNKDFIASTGCCGANDRSNMWLLMLTILPKVEAKALATIMMTKITHVLWKNIIYWFSLLNSIVTDNDIQFDCSCFRQLCSQFNINICFSSLAHP